MKGVNMNIRLFTDGACSNNPGPGGYGCLVLMHESIIKVSGYEENTTNNRMELKAVIKGIEKVLNVIYQENYDVEKLEVISDSSYVVNAFNKNWFKKWKTNGFKTVEGKEIKNIDLWLELDKFLNEIEFLKINLVFTKIKGHAGDYFNETVDELAKSEIVKNRRN